MLVQFDMNLKTKSSLTLRQLAGMISNFSPYSFASLDFPRFALFNLQVSLYTLFTLISIPFAKFLHNFTYILNHFYNYTFFLIKLYLLNLNSNYIK